MRRKIILASILVVVLTMSACGSKEDSETTAITSVTTETTQDLESDTETDSEMEVIVPESTETKAVETKTAEAKSKQSEFIDEKLKGMSFRYNNLYDFFVESDNLLKITYEQGKALTFIHAAVAESVEASFLDDEASMNLAHNTILLQFDERQLEETNDVSLSGTTARASAFVGKLNDQWYYSTVVSLTDGEWYYTVYYVIDIDIQAEHTSEYIDDFNALVESISFN